METDHLPLIGLMNKDINQLSPRLAAMHLELLADTIKLEHNPGFEMVLADTLSRSCPKGTNLCEDLAVDPLLSVCLVVIRSEEAMSKYQAETARDELQAVINIYRKGRPRRERVAPARPWVIGI